ncbi:MAG: 50S ribosomal protein L17 [Chloroflexi bacterium]|nr:50S ribosomal protein L17 [Chloroflexota bacterium]MBI3742546.1 50S ribosomal protein L17 [Chloroflexota bacterium]
MRHRVAGKQLNRDKSARKALFRSLITELFRYERMETTEAKAKAIRADAEKLITLAKRGDLHARRLAARTLLDQKITEKLFATLGPRYKERAGGYTRIFKIGPRLGDAAPIVIMELVDRETA